MYNGEQIKKEVGEDMKRDCDPNSLYGILEEFMKIHYFNYTSKNYSCNIKEMRVLERYLSQYNAHFANMSI